MSFCCWVALNGNSSALISLEVWSTQFELEPEVDPELELELFDELELLEEPEESDEEELLEELEDEEEVQSVFGIMVLLWVFVMPPA